MNRHTRYRPAITARNTSTQRSRHSRFHTRMSHPDVTPGCHTRMSHPDAYRMHSSRMPAFVRRTHPLTTFWMRARGHGRTRRCHRSRRCSWQTVLRLVRVALVATYTLMLGELSVIGEDGAAARATARREAVQHQRHQSACRLHVRAAPNP